MRYHVADAGTLEAVRQAINSTKPAGGARMVGGVLVPLTDAQFAAECARLGIEPGQLVHTSRLLVVGSDAVLELPETPHVEACLGRTVGGRAIPSAASLAQVTRARDHAQFAAGIRDALDDRYVDSELDGADDVPAARGRVTAELQGRAAAALARKDARAGAQAIERALGLGRGE